MFVGVDSDTRRGQSESTHWGQEFVAQRLYTRSGSGESHFHTALEHLKETAYQRYRELKIEPPAKKHLERLIRSTLHTYTEHFCADIFQRIPPATRAWRVRLHALLDAILETSEKVDIQAAERQSSGEAVVHYSVTPSASDNF